jgi:uncharacterized protein
MYYFAVINRLTKTQMTAPQLEKIPLFPLSNGLFPDSLLMLNIFEVRYLNLIKECEKQSKPFGVVWLADGSEIQTAGKAQVFHDHGTLACLNKIDRVHPSLLQVRCTGGLRFSVQSSELGPFGVWYGNVVYEAQDSPVEIPTKYTRLADQLGQLIANAQKQNMSEHFPFEAPYRLDEAGWVANRWAELLPFAPHDKLELLMEKDPLQRLERISGLVEF